MTVENVIKMREHYKDRGYYIITAGYGARYYNEIALQGAFMIWDDANSIVHAIRSNHENYLEVGAGNDKTLVSIATIGYEEIETFNTHVSGKNLAKLATTLGADAELIERIKKFY